MKNILFITCLLVLGSASFSIAQLNGKQFLSGSAGINFDNSNPASSGSTNNYNYNFDISLGKFKSETRAAGWRISNSLGGGKMSYYNGSQTDNYEFDGINRFGVGLGRFWHFYKHFNDKLGVYGGPEAGVSFVSRKSYSNEIDEKILIENGSQQIQLSLGLSAGLYYAFSEKWWVTASLAFANPVSVDYSFQQARNVVTDAKNKGNELTYRFSPVFTFPSVGLGLRYFYNR